MIILRNAALIGVAAVVVSGCSSSGGSGDNGPPLVHGYNPTFYQDGTTLAQARANGIEGLAVNANGSTTAKITTTADSIDVVVDGQSYNLPLYTEGQLSGYDVAAYENPDNQGDAIVTYDGEYSGFAAILAEETGLPHTLIVTGQETEHLPSQQASYTGDWLTAEGYIEAQFGADVDFDAGNIDYTVDAGDFIGVGSAKLTGSQFQGDIAFSGAETGSGSIFGALFGPRAEELAGTSHGTIGGEDYQAIFHGRQEP